jgi:hypothetical protein
VAKNKSVDDYDRGFSTTATLVSALLSAAAKGSSPEEFAPRPDAPVKPRRRKRRMKPAMRLILPHRTITFAAGELELLLM